MPGSGSSFRTLSNEAQPHVQPDPPIGAVLSSPPSVAAGRLTRAFGDAQTYGELLPPKIRELISELQKAGFTDRGGKGSHLNCVHPKVTKPITISGSPGDDAKHYQVRAVRRALEESKS